MSFTIAIDGPGASGKSTISRLLAQELNYKHIDTGALYRSIAYYAVKNKIDHTNESNFNFINQLNISYHAGLIYLNGVDISQEIREPEIAKTASMISKYQLVRNNLLNLQRRLASDGNIIMDGRDIGTVILPNADLKIFLTADLSTRAKRRQLEENDKPLAVVQAELHERDMQDITREIAPLVKAQDAIEIDTSKLSLIEVVAIIKKLIIQKGAK